MAGWQGEVAAELFVDDGQFPNSPLPLLFYREVFTVGKADAPQFEALFRRHGWPPEWRASVFTYHHYHSTTHEALGVAAGEATLMLGGPKGREFHLRAGDAVVIPAGVAHRRITASTDFLVVGAYPEGSPQWDILRGNPDDRPRADRNIAQVPLPEQDPVAGAKGPLGVHWR